MRKNLPRKVLILGSGALKIGEAGEFDYSGSQAIKALKEEGIRTILINPNIATIQTSQNLASEVYFLPVTTHFVRKVIEREKPDGILLGFGGQTALNCGLELDRQGIFKQYAIKVLGTQVSAIEKTEDRELFKKELEKIDVLTPRSIACHSKEKALEAATQIGYPVIIRAGFALGGKGSGSAYTKAELEDLLDSAFAFSPQVLVEENLKGWKEVEYEVVRDQYDNCVTVCNMENVDPLGIHTGESIVVAPSQTLTNNEYHLLRELSIRVIRHFGIVGECNIQFALNPNPPRGNELDYRVIEVNARLSRSSALASKATGYPLAHVAAKLALGYSLPELKNAVTKTTTACFEPALDYLALKIPRWDLDKFKKVSHEITTEMKSVGEIMALGRSFEEVLQKGLRMLQIGLQGFTGNEGLNIETENLEHALRVPTPKRILALAEALRKNWSTERIMKLTGINQWFLDKMKNIVEMEKKLSGQKREIKKFSTCGKETILKAKQYGFSDKQIGLVLDMPEKDARRLRKRMGIEAYTKQIDTMAAEYPAKTNYLYLTYHGEKDDAIDQPKREKRKKIMVLGSGAYSIGSSVEFDWCGVTTIQTLAKEGYETIMVNYNPETVSTDYDICDRLYFDELSLERVLDIYEKERPFGVIIATGGQVPNTLAMKLHDFGVKILGTSPKDIDRAENRHKFSALLDELSIDQPKWQQLSEIEKIHDFANKVGYPVLVRPSYVLSGAAMSVAQNEQDLTRYLERAARISQEAPVVVSKFEEGAKEIEIDAVAYKGRLVISAITEHVENAGVHSGDATMVLPPQKLYFETLRKIKEIALAVAKELNISGPFNIQFLAKNNEIKVIECNLRASRSFPFVSKVTGHNFIEIATYVMLSSSKIKPYLKLKFRTLELEHVGVKAPQFSFSRLKGADPVTGVEMASTGEVACFGDDVFEALLKAMISAGTQLPGVDSRGKNVLLTIGKLEDKIEMVDTAKKLEKMGFTLHATEGTYELFKQHGIETKLLHKIRSPKKPNLLEYLSQRKLDLVIDIPKSYSHEAATEGYLIRRKAIDHNIPLITNIQLAKLFVEALTRYHLNDLPAKPWSSYV